jgi:hypothetical protein
MQPEVKRWVGLYAFVVLAIAWMIGAGTWIAPTWSLRDALAKTEQAREEDRCAFREGGQDHDNAERCRDTVQLIHDNENATAYFEDGLIVFVPALLAIGAGFVCLRRGLAPTGPPVRSLRMLRWLADRKKRIGGAGRTPL